MEASQPAVLMEQRKRIALVAHDNKKQDLLEWARYNVETLRPHQLCATGTTGTLLMQALGLEIGSTDRRQDRATGDRFCDFLLGSIGAAATRPRCESAAARGDGVEHPDGVQSRIGRFHDLFAAHVFGLRTHFA